MPIDLLSLHLILLVSNIERLPQPQNVPPGFPFQNMLFNKHHTTMTELRIFMHLCKFKDVGMYRIYIAIYIA